MENVSMYFCLKLKERHKEYNKDNPPIKFSDFLKLLQYSKEEIDSIFKVMDENSKERIRIKKQRSEIIHRIKSTIPISTLWEDLENKHLGRYKNGKWKWEKDALFEQYDNMQLQKLLENVSTHTTTKTIRLNYSEIQKLYEFANKHSDSVMKVNQTSGLIGTCTFVECENEKENITDYDVW